MKKLLIPLSLMTVALLPGCTTTDKKATINENIAKTLSDNISQIMESVKNVNDIDENKLIINELKTPTSVNQDYTDGSKNINNIPKIPAKSISDGLIKRSTKVYPARRVKSSASSTTQNTNTYSPTINPTSKGDYVSDAGVKSNRYYTSQYNPRYNVSTATANTQLTSYIEKIQDLYTICNDTCAASYDLESLKTELLTSCNNCKNLLSKVNNGQIKLSNKEIKTLTEYNNTLQGCINDLKGCKGCAEDVNMINSLKGNFSNNCDTLVAKYLKVLNNLDTNNSYCNNAKCTVAEINNYIANITGEKDYVNKTYQSRYVVYSSDLQPNNYINKIDNNLSEQNKANTTSQDKNNTQNNSNAQPSTNVINNSTINKTTVPPTTTSSTNNQYTPTSAYQKTTQNNALNSNNSAQYTQSATNTQTNQTTQNSSNNNQTQTTTIKTPSITQPIRSTSTNNINDTRKAIQSRQNMLSSDNRTYDIKESERPSNNSNTVAKPAPHRTKDIKDADYRYINANKGIRTLEETKHNEVARDTAQNTKNVNTYTPSPRRGAYTTGSHHTTTYRTVSNQSNKLTGYTNNYLAIDTQKVRASSPSRNITF